MTHVSVLLQEAIAGLDIDSGDIFVDATLGDGGHSARVAEMFGRGVKIVGIDADAEAIKRSRARLAEVECDVTFVEDNFRNLDAILAGLGVHNVDKILFDLGMSSFQIEESGRGFSFRRSEPLIMTFAPPRQSFLTAYELVNFTSKEELRDIIRRYGEERYAGRIAAKIASVRKEERIQKADELAEIIAGAVPASYRHGRIHPATRTFQALRIAVNDELTALSEGIAAGFERLSKQGRMAVISFHSLEDRIVKRFFRGKVAAYEGQLVTKKPIAASEEEMAANPRARSAKLRIIEKR